VSTLRARWILPIDAPPIADGWVDFEHGRIVRVGAGPRAGPAEDLGDVAVLPALVNAHTHLELSWLAGRVPPAASMVEWIRRLIRERAHGPTGGPTGAEEFVARAATALHASGTALIGDISNTLGAVSALDALGIGGVVFHELLGFNPPDPHTQVRDAWARVTAAENRHRESVFESSAPRTDSRCRFSFSVVAHAPYSASPALFTEIARSAREAPLSVHLGESPEEIEFLHTGRGPFRELLEQLGVWTEAWQPPACGPVEYLRRLGYLQPGCLVVHGVHLTAKDRAMLRDTNAVLVTCPRSNAWVGAGLPPITRFYDEGLRVAIGTDSLASAASLSMFDELAELRRIAPEVAAGRLLESATRIGAEALGVPDFGTIRPGQRAVFAVVEVPRDVTDVEEYLVSGIRAEQVRPLSHSPDLPFSR
jgi:cytosine/adenosine deaminase-related metal-dependent hydrolase